MKLSSPDVVVGIDASGKGGRQRAAWQRSEWRASSAERKIGVYLWWWRLVSGGGESFWLGSVDVRAWLWAAGSGLGVVAGGWQSGCVERWPGWRRRPGYGSGALGGSGGGCGGGG